MKRLASIVCSMLLAASLRAACTATAQNKGSGTYVTSGTTATVSATVHAVGDLVVFSGWCGSTCGSGYTLAFESGNLTEIGTKGTSSSSTGEPHMFYKLSATATGAQTATITVTASEQLQVGYIDFSPSAGCSFAHDVDSSLSSGSGLNVNAPSITPTNTGEVLYQFASISGSTIGTAASPWTAGTVYSSTGNGDEYILSSSSGSTTASYSSGSANNWESIITSFVMSSTSSGPCTIATLGVGRC